MLEPIGELALSVPMESTYTDTSCGKKQLLLSLLEPLGLASVPVCLASAGALNSMEPVKYKFACREEIDAHVHDPNGGWCHRFGYYGGGFSYCPSQVSSAQWPPAYCAEENEHRTDNFTRPHNNQSQPGPSSLVLGAWDGTYDYTDLGNIETDLPDQHIEYIENAYSKQLIDKCIFKNRKTYNLSEI